MKNKQTLVHIDHIGNAAKIVHDELRSSIQANICFAVRQTTSWAKLVSLCPSITEIVWNRCDSGFNDGDPTYTVSISLFSNSEGYDEIDECYRISVENDIWDVETSNDKIVYNEAKMLSQADFDNFVDIYSDLVNDLDKRIGQYYGHNTVRLTIV